MLHQIPTGRTVAAVEPEVDRISPLADLVRGRSRPELFHVSVIRFNDAVGAAGGLRAPSSTRVDEFVRGLVDRGVRATRRRQLGTGIDAACGQLHASYLRGNGSAQNDAAVGSS